MSKLMRILLIVVLGTAMTLMGCEVAHDEPTFPVDPEDRVKPDGPPRVIVSVAPGHSSEDIRAFVLEHGGRLVHDSKLISAVTVVMPDQDAVDRLRLIPSVSDIEEDGLVYAISWAPDVDPDVDNDDDLGSQPSDPHEIEQDSDQVWASVPCENCHEYGHEFTQFIPWGIDRVQALSVHDQTTGAGIKVAVLDTGIDPDHPDLNVMGGINVLEAYDDPTAWADDYGHGTHVAGTIAALDNCSHVIGVAPDAELYSVKVLNYWAIGNISDVIAGIEWSVNNGVRVINMSIGGWDDTQAFSDACAAAEDAGVYMAVAAGNSGNYDPSTGNVLIPARYPSVIAVSAIDESNVIADFSSHGPEVDHTAPGEEVESLQMGGDTSVNSGTSMAAPHDAGAAALLFSYNPSSSLACVRAALTLSATDLGDVGYDEFYGYGLINLPAAIEAIDFLCP